MAARTQPWAKPWIDFDYPRGSPLEPAGGRWPAGPEAFCVEELPLYPFVGDGEHAALIVERRDRPTRDVALAVARRLQVPTAAVGYAGMKDKDCVSVQGFTVTGVREADARGAFEAEGCRVIASTRHRNKLRLGHLAGNRFRVLLRGSDTRRAAEILESLAVSGAPNYFGPQRFGSRGDNAAQGFAVLRGARRVDRWKRDLFVSALQSLVFNEVLARRVEEGLLGQALEGDVLQREDSGGLFVCENTGADGPRVAAFEVSPTGPMPGRKMIAPAATAKEREAAVLDALGLDGTLFSSESGTRRPLRIRPEGVSVEPTQEGVWLSFTCQGGAYATSVVREVTGAVGRSE